MVLGVTTLYSITAVTNKQMCTVAHIFQIWAVTGMKEANNEVKT